MCTVQSRVPFSSLFFDHSKQKREKEKRKLYLLFLFSRDERRCLWDKWVESGVCCVCRRLPDACMDCGMTVGIATSTPTQKWISLLRYFHIVNASGSPSHVTHTTSYLFALIQCPHLFRSVLLLFLLFYLSVVVWWTMVIVCLLKSRSNLPNYLHPKWIHYSPQFSLLFIYGCKYVVHTYYSIRWYIDTRDTRTHKSPDIKLKWVNFNFMFDFLSVGTENKFRRSRADMDVFGWNISSSSSSHPTRAIMNL